MANEVQSLFREQPGCVAPEPPLRSLRRGNLSLEQYTDGILRGDRTILAQAITLVESSRETDRSLTEQILETCAPHSGRSIRVGITGAPGAGKSSLIEALGSYLIRKSGHKLAVFAVDPSSQISGGSILGDKTRMNKLASSEMAFVRPSPSRGSLGGVAQHTREAMLLCEAAGYQNILVETVGVGQSEAAVHNIVDFVVLLGLAGAGDELQGIKRGVMEFADLVAINKADGDNLPAAERARNDAENALHLLPASSSGWTPRALTCSALTGDGVAEIWNCIEEYVSQTKANGWFAEARHKQAQSWMHEIVEAGLRQRLESHPAIRTRRAFLEKELLEGRITSLRAARDLLKVISDAFGADCPVTQSAAHSEPNDRGKA